MVYYGRFFVSGSVCLALACGGNTELLEEEVYNGPIQMIVDENTMMTDSGRTAMRIKSLKRLDFKNGDKEWPEGLKLETYTRRGRLKSTFSANVVTYSNIDNLYKGVGNVIVKNYQNQDELNTEELFWDPKNKKFFTEKFVSITSEGEVHTGEGLTADESFESYTILKPSGTLILDDSP